MNRNDLIDQSEEKTVSRKESLLLLVPLIGMMLICVNTLYTIFFDTVEINGVVYRYMMDVRMIAGALGLLLCLAFFFINKRLYKMALFIFIVLWWVMLIRLKFSVHFIFIINVVPAFFMALHIGINAKSVERFVRARRMNAAKEAKPDKSYERFLKKFENHSPKELEQLSKDTERTEAARRAAKELLERQQAN